MVNSIWHTSYLYGGGDTDILEWFGCLDKAAIILPTKPLEEEQKNRWKLCRATEVEETKLTIRMIPLCITFIFCGVVSAIGNTYVIEQANHMNHKLGKLSIPIAILLWFYDQGKQQFAKLYYKLAVKLGGSGARHYAPLIGVVVSMVFAILCCIIAAKVETKRLNVARTHGLVDKPDERIPMSVFWLLPQFVLIGSLDGILENSVEAILFDQVGPSMRTYVVHFGVGVTGLGIMGSFLSVYVAGRESESEDEDAPNYYPTSEPFEDNARCCCC
ncbi:Protein NRT1/ PTR FAMILY 5.5 [Camellia lanceoleosa]|uniref:Protein NRT1/ PTR FAMILY 5.5 n=1 Tax=Camellia lanceoleosa TaxID=1840588 RepID=A0ACC0G7Y7_9ERIC|nr:Protein NRT1/ PTR FAMILY 5.5 [Camellia lanceoleosa]